MTKHLSMFDPTRIAADRAVIGGATPGEWRYDNMAFVWNGQMMICDIRGFGYLTATLGLSEEKANDQMDANGRFIAAARTGWPEALDEIERLRVAAQADVQHHCHTCAFRTDPMCPGNTRHDFGYKDNCDKWQWQHVQKGAENADS